MAIPDLLFRWPFLRQLATGLDATGLEAASPATRELRARITGAGVTTARSVCPYCAVGCGQLVHVKDGAILDIEGDPDSPISAGRLCPKGAASHQLLTHDGRLTEVLYRAPRAREFVTLPLERAMDMIAERVWSTRARTFVERDPGGRPLNHTTAIAHLGGATLDNEENYLIKKLFTAGLGMVAVSNQARV
jgi:formate dehydrogenase major subunit